MPRAAKLNRPAPSHSAPSNEPLSPLAKELRKKTPFQSLEQEAYLNLLRTISVLCGDAERELKRHGLSEATYNALRILRGAGPAGRPCSRIADDMVARVPDITRIVDRLESADHAARSRESDDRRIVMVRITKAGLDLLAKLDEPVLGLHKQQLGHLSRAELTQLNALLVKARRAPWRTENADA